MRQTNPVFALKFLVMHVTRNDKAASQRTFLKTLLTWLRKTNYVRCDANFGWSKVLYPNGSPILLLPQPLPGVCEHTRVCSHTKRMSNMINIWKWNLPFSTPRDISDPLPWRTPLRARAIPKGPLRAGALDDILQNGKLGGSSSSCSRRSLCVLGYQWIWYITSWYIWWFLC